MARRIFTLPFVSFARPDKSRLRDHLDGHPECRNSIAQPQPRLILGKR
jgi:hypothetical protein